MADGMEVYAPSLRQGGARLADVAAEVSAEWAALRGQAAEMGDIFGDDDVGALIGMSYQAAEEIAVEFVQSVVDGLNGFSQGLGVMADEFELVEQDNRAGFDGLAW